MPLIPCHTHAGMQYVLSHAESAHGHAHVHAHSLHIRYTFARVPSLAPRVAHCQMQHRFCAVAPGDTWSTKKIAEVVAIGGAGGCIPLIVVPRPPVGCACTYACVCTACACANGEPNGERCSICVRARCAACKRTCRGIWPANATCASACDAARAPRRVRRYRVGKVVNVPH